MNKHTAAVADAAGQRVPKALTRLGSPLVLALVAYLALVLVLLPNYLAFQYKDEITYVAAAERYARGDFANAPNSLWGPLLSWLMALAMSLGAPSLAAARIVSVVAGAATLWAVDRLATTMAFPDGLKRLYLLTLVPYVTYFTLFSVNADLPLTALLIAYFAIVFDPGYPNRRFAGVVCGLLGALSYYAKGFALGFFMVHFTACTVVHWIAQENAAARGKVLRHFAFGLAVFAALAAIWVAALYQKYGVVTVGITGEYNYQIKGPEAKDRPALYIGFAEPPKSTTVSIWEDPAYFYDLPQARECCLKPWTPLDSQAALKHQLLLFESNLGRTLTAFLSWSAFTLAVLFAAIAYCFAPFWPTRRTRSGSPSDKKWSAIAGRHIGELRDALVDNQRLMPTLMLLTLLIYPVPYLFVFADERYIWPLLIVVMGLGFYLLQIFTSAYAVRQKTRAWLIGLFAASFLLNPIYKLSTGLEARDAMASMTQQIQSVANLSGARIASGNDYGGSMIMAYHVDGKYYGSAAPWMSEREILDDLRRKGIEYYFVWDLPVVPRPGMTLSRVLKADFRTLAIYKVESETPAAKPSVTN